MMDKLNIEKISDWTLWHYLCDQRALVEKLETEYKRRGMDKRPVVMWSHLSNQPPAGEG